MDLKSEEKSVLHKSLLGSSSFLKGNSKAAKENSKENSRTEKGPSQEEPDSTPESPSWLILQGPVPAPSCRGKVGQRGSEPLHAAVGWLAASRVAHTRVR